MNTALVKPPTQLTFAFTWLFIIASSVYDAGWVLSNRAILSRYEKNPLGRLLIDLNDGDVWLLLLVKAIGTVLAASLLLLLYWTYPRLGWIACLVTAAFQFALIVYLHW